MLAVTEINELQAVAGQTIRERQQFAQSLRESLHVSAQQWQPMEHILAFTTASRFNIYAYYPHLFMSAFPPVDSQVLNDLAWMGRCALDYVLLYDCLLDCRKLPDPIILLSSYAFQREYMMRLQHYFSPDSALWKHLSLYEHETAHALIDEQTQRQTPFAASNISLNAMRQQAIGKAAISRLAIVALACLTDTCGSDIMRGLITSNDHYNFARQITDDLLDWRKDYEAARYSPLLINALQSLGITQDTPRDEYPVPNRVGGAIYTRFADDYLSAADASLKEAVQLAETYHTHPSWMDNLTVMRASISRQCAVLADARRVSTTHKTIQRPQKQGNALEETLNKAQSFLLERQSTDGCWRDFATSAGESEDWVTGYVGWALLSSNCLTDDARQRAVEWLLQSQFPQGGWGYHQHVVVDADSTAWCTRFLARTAMLDQSQDLKHTLDKAVSVLLSHQRSGGGFSTYYDPEPIRAYIQADADRDLSGWCMPQMCVTAAALAALHEAGAETSTTQSAMNYVLAQQEGGLWRSYWWEGPHYATVYMLRALSSFSCDEVKAISSQAWAWLRSVQRADGSWSISSVDTPNSSGLPFYTALAVQGLLMDDSRESQTATQQGVDWLIQHQEADGGWQASARLLLPETHDQHPWLIREWPVQIHGTGIARRDHRRIFTTATVLKALHEALSQKYDVPRS